MQTSKIAKITIEIIECLFIILFTYTGLNKLLDLDTFQFQTHRSPYLENISTLVSYTIPTAELLTVLAIMISKFRTIPAKGWIFNWLRKNGAKLEYFGICGAYFLMSLFTGYVWLMLHRAYYLPCSCGGILSAMSWDDHLKFNAFFTILAVVATLLSPGAIFLDNSAPSSKTKILLQ